MLAYIMLGFTFAIAAAVQPGPLQTYIISETLTNGWRRTLPASFAPVISDGPIIILVLFVLSRVPPFLVQVLHFAGALFLFYLSYRTFKTWKNFYEKEEIRTTGKHQTLWKAVLVNILNPNPYLGWSLVMGPMFFKGYNEKHIYGIVLIIAFYSVFVFAIAGTIILFAFARRFGPKIIRILLGISVIGLACFGFYELWIAILMFK